MTQRNLDVEIKKRSEFTGLSVEEVKRRLYMAYFNMGVNEDFEYPENKQHCIYI